MASLGPARGEGGGLDKRSISALNAMHEAFEGEVLVWEPSRGAQPTALLTSHRSSTQPAPLLACIEPSSAVHSRFRASSVPLLQMRRLLEALERCPYRRLP
jgi:hypothetical protein